MNLPVATSHSLCANELGNVLPYTEKDHARDEEVGHIPLREAQPESGSELAPTAVAPLKIEACGEEGSGEKEIEKEKDGEEMFGLFPNKAAKHVWSEYTMLMTGEKRDMDGEYCNTDKEHATTIVFLSLLDAWIMSFVELLGTDEKRG